MEPNSKWWSIPGFLHLLIHPFIIGFMSKKQGILEMATISNIQVAEIVLIKQIIIGIIVALTFE